MSVGTINSQDAPDEVSVLIEVSQNSHPVKYEMDKDTGILCVDRFLPTAMYYPCNYGYIPNTMAGDGDPVDVLVLSRFPVIPGAVVRSRPVGVLSMRDEKGEDLKVLAVPAASVDPYYAGVANYTDLPSVFLDSIAHFFTYYKKLEKEKFVSVGDWQDAVRAKAIIEASVVTLQ